MDTDEKFRTAIHEAVVFLPIDAEKGEGVSLAERFSISSYPTYILLNPDGQTVDRWRGYGSPDGFLSTLQAAVNDPSTVEEKIARFEGSPNASDAEKLGRIYSASEDPEKALSMYRAALELTDGPGIELTGAIFWTLANGYSSETFTLDEVRAGADAVLALDDPEATMTLVQVARMMGSIGAREDNRELSWPYLKAALEATEGTQEPAMIKARRELLLEKALHLDNDLEAAVQLKRDTMPEGWKEDPNQLNSFAWWCFENKVNLEEAEKLAKIGVELSEAGSQKAMILDTVAELCFEQGNSDEAIELMQAAMEEDPENEYYREQLERFRNSGTATETGVSATP